MGDGVEKKDWEMPGGTVVRPTKEVSLEELEEAGNHAVENGGHLVIEGTGSGQHIKVTPVKTVVEGMPAPKKKK
jgi:hypothetical protein